MMGSFGELINLSKISQMILWKNCHKTKDNQLVIGIGKSPLIKGQGKITRTFEADNGNFRTLLMLCFCTLSANRCIASVHKILQAHPKESIVMKDDKLQLSRAGKIPDITIWLSPMSMLPMGVVKQVLSTKSANELGKEVINNKCKSANPQAHKN